MRQPNERHGVRAGKRPTVAVVYDDVTQGYRCADWLALHGYQATMTSTVHPLEENLKELRPDLIVLGVPSFPAPLQATVPRLKMTCPHVPIIAMMERSIAKGADPDFPKTFGPDVFMCDSLDPPAAIP
ncbi:MAG: hypothetical protein GDA68_10550 [Nitrospira sp. CR2.1]|nr:hypothetical protein [Nitrospira sp. CR2.1]MBA5875488.1 hypothetical protein [Nitrospira sp. CR1.2]